MTTPNKQGVATDIHNEYSVCNHPDPEVKYKQRKCNHCGAVRNRNITTLVHHINVQCDKAKNKYHSNGQLKRASQAPNSCNWSSATSASPALTQQDLDDLEFKRLIAEKESMKDQYQPHAAHKKAAKKRKLNEIGAAEEVYLNGRDIRSYMKGPAPMTSQEKEEANAAWALFYSVCDVPIELIEHPLFISAIHKTRAEYKPPSVTCCKTTYIDKLVNEDEKYLTTELDGQKAWISADGSENNSKESVMHILATGTFGTRLIDQIYHEPGTKLTAARIHQDVIACRERYFDKHGVDIEYGGYLHDNENTEKAVGRLFRETEERGDAGCGPHGGNKLNNYVFLDAEWKESKEDVDTILNKTGKGKIKHILDRNIRTKRIEKRLLDNDKDGVFVRNPRLLTETVNAKLSVNKEVIGHPKPGQTRQWSNMIKSYKFVVENEREFKLLLTQPEAQDYIHLELRKLLLSDAFWSDTKEKYPELLPVDESLIKLQNKQCNLSNVFWEFKRRLPEIFGDKEPFKSALERAWNLIKSDTHYASMSVDPRFGDSCKLSFEELEIAEGYFKLVLGDIHWNESKDLFDDYQAGTGPFKHRLFTECRNDMNKEQAQRPWKVMLNNVGNESHKLFIEENIFLLEAPTGITDNEKSFCRIRRTHSWDRSSMTSKLLSKLNKIAINWRLRNNLF